MQPAGGTPESAERFHTLYESCYQAIYAYVLRRTTAGHDDVPDIVAEVFVVAWRRRHVIPEPPEGRLWLYGVARRVLRDHERRVTRRQRLEARLREQASTGPAGAGDPAYLSMRAAVARLRPRYREALQLVAWDGLSHAEAAAVLGCSTNAVAVTIHRAKAQLKKELSQPGPASAAAAVSSPASES